MDGGRTGRASSSSRSHRRQLRRAAMSEACGHFANDARIPSDAHHRSVSSARPPAPARRRSCSGHAVSSTDHRRTAVPSCDCTGRDQRPVRPLRRRPDARQGHARVVVSARRARPKERGAGPPGEAREPRGRGAYALDRRAVHWWVFEAPPTSTEAPAFPGLEQRVQGSAGYSTSCSRSARSSRVTRPPRAAVRTRLDVVSHWLNHYASCSHALVPTVPAPADRAARGRARGVLQGS
jgi:hypothetical protein